MSYNFDEIYGDEPAPTEAPTATPPASPTARLSDGGYDFDSIYGADPVAATPQAAVQASIYDASFGNPDEEAKRRQVARDLEKFLGDTTPPAVIDINDAQRRLRVAEADHATRASPRTSAWLSNPENAKIAADDVKTLANIERILDDFQYGSMKPSAGPELSLKSLAGGLSEAFTQGAERARQGIRQQFADLFDLEDMSAASRRKFEQAQSREFLATPEIESTTGRAIYGGLQSTVRQVPGLAASILTRSTAPMLAAAGVQTEAEAYGKYKARGGQPGESFLAAVGEGAVEVLTELIPLRTMLGAFGEPGKKAASEFFKSQVQEQFGEQAATLLQDAIDTAVANPDKTWGDYWRERPGAAYETFIATLTQSGVMGGVHYAVGRFAQQQADGAQAEAGAQTLQDLFSAAEQSLTRGRDTQTFNAFFQDVAGDATVFVDPVVLRQAAEQAGIDEARLPSLTEQSAEASNVGAGVEIPVAELVSAFTGTGIEQQIIENTRMAPDAATLAEVRADGTKAMEFFQVEAAKALEQATQQEEFRTAAEVVKSDVLNEIKAAAPEKITTQQQEGYASLVGAFYSTIASRIGITPLQLRDGWTDSAGVQHRGYRLGVLNEQMRAARATGQQFDQAFRQSANDFLTAFDMADTIELVAPTTSEEEIDRAQTEFLSHFPKTGRYPRDTGLLRRIRRASEKALDALDGSPETDREVASTLGPFSAYNVGAEVLEGDSLNPNGSLRVTIFGKEQVEAGLIDEPALTITVTADGELTLNGPSPNTATFDEFKSRGWADYARGADGTVQTGWSALKDPANPDKPLPITQILPLLADTHARVREWRGEDYVGMHWTRATGALGGLFDQDESAVFFQEQGKNLVALHNLSAENLKFADDMGGLSVPSIGVVTRDKGGVEGFGEITLIGDRRLADPSTEPVFSSDAYTARFPKPEWPKAKSKDAMSLVEMVRAAGKEFDDRGIVDSTYDNMVNTPDATQVVSAWLRSDAVQALFLREHGIDVKPATGKRYFRTYLTAEQLEDLRPLYAVVNEQNNNLPIAERDTPEAEDLSGKIRGYLYDNLKREGKELSPAAEKNIDRIAGQGVNLLYSDYNTLREPIPVDRSATSEQLRIEIDKRAPEFKAWVEGHILPKFGAPFIKDGRKRVPYTLPNIVSAMTSPKVRGEEKSMTFGAGQARAASSVQFSDVEEMRAAAKTAIANTDEYAAAKEETEKLLDAYRTAVVEHTKITDWRGKPDIWEAMDASMRALAKWSTSRVRDAASMRKALQSEDFKVSAIPAGAIDKAIAAGNALRSAPVPYFESKPQRAVSLNEFTGALIPEKSSPETRAILEKHGIKVREYGEESARSEEAKAFAEDLGVLFQQERAQQRGAFSPRTLDISFLANADASTFLHETGHFFLTVYSDLASQADAPAEIKSDMDALLKWFGVTGQEKGLPGGAELGQAAYHGSPYRFDKFSLDHMGKGEGNQAFGWGLYFAGNQEVAEFYRSMLGGDTVTVDGKQLRELEPDQADIAKAVSRGRPLDQVVAEISDDIAKWDRRLEKHPEDEEIATRGFMARKKLAAAESLRGADIKETKGGQVYSVDIPDDKNLLAWDAPLTKQPAAVRKALAEFIPTGTRWVDTDGKEIKGLGRVKANVDPEYGASRGWKREGKANPTGEQIYSQLKQELGSAEAVSKRLNELGIPGLRYPEGTIAGTGGTHYNYVIFDENAVQIAQTFYQGGEVPVPGPLPAGRTPLEVWNALSLDQQRPYHEQFAESFEEYLFKGRAPTKELQSLFRRFAKWLTSVYGSVRDFVSRNKGAKLNEEVSAIFDRMIATDAEIEAMRAARAYTQLFRNAAEAGMNPADFAAYQALDPESIAEAEEQLRTRGLRDMKWLQNRRNKVIAELQEEAKERRAEVMIDARREVMTQPLYKAWQFLTSKIAPEDRISPAPKRKSDPDVLDDSVDSLLTAIAKLGGLDKAEVLGTWGTDPADKPQSGVFGKPVWRIEGGMSIDAMAEALGQYGYLNRDENGKVDLSEFELLFAESVRGNPQYSLNVDAASFEQRRPGEMIANPSALMAGKFDRQMLRELGLHPEFIEHLESLRMVADTGLPPDMVADMFGGFTSGEDLVRQLLAAQPPKVEIEALTDRYMLERYGDLSSQKAIERAADEAIHNDARTRMVATELHFLGESIGKPGVLIKAAREYARQIVETKSLKTLKPANFAAEETRAGKGAMEALRKGDRAEAARLKRTELLNHAAAKEAYAAAKEMEKIVNRLKKIADTKDEAAAQSREMDMVNATRAILAEFGIGRHGAKAAAYLKTVEALDPDMSAALDDIIGEAAANARDYRTIPLRELRELSSMVEAVWSMAKTSKQIQVEGKRLQLEDVRRELTDKLLETAKDPAKPKGLNLTKAETAKVKFGRLATQMKRPEAWVGMKDGADTFGPWRRYIWKTINDAQTALTQEKSARLKQMKDLVRPVMQDMVPQKIEAPEIGVTFGASDTLGYSELLHALLHTGNESNKRKLLLGRGWAVERADGTLDTSNWDAMIARLHREGKITKRHWDFVQSVWDFMEDLKPGAQRAHKEAFGRYFDEVTSAPIDTPFGQYKGGYVPARADRMQVADADLKAMTEAGWGSMLKAFPTSRRGFTKSRVEYNVVLELNLQSLTRHVDEVLIFSHMNGPVRDVQRILKGGELSSVLAVQDREAINYLILPWLQHAAQQTVTLQGNQNWENWKIWSKLRSRTGAAIMFANLKNVTQQLTSFFPALLKVKPGYLMHAAVTNVLAPRDLAKHVSAMSPYMNQRINDETYALASEIDEILLNPTKLESAQHWSMKHAYFMQMAVDNWMGPTIWLAKYNETMESAPAGMTESEIKAKEREAIELADSAVRMTQGAMRPIDVAAFEGGSPFARMFTQFAGFFSTQMNLMGEQAVIAQQMPNVKKKYARLGMVAFLGWYAPAIASEIISVLFAGGPPDEDKDGEYLDDWLRQILVSGPVKYATAMVPIAGQGIQAVVNAFNDKPYDDRLGNAPAVGALESAGKATGAAYKLVTDPDYDPKPGPIIRDTGMLLSILTGLPVLPAAKSIGYFADVESGRISPTSPTDFARGTITGVASPESK